jgi:hypothetical protein
VQQPTETHMPSQHFPWVFFQPRSVPFYLWDNYCGKLENIIINLKP